MNRMLSGDDKSNRIIHVDSDHTIVYKDDLAILEDSSSSVFKKHVKNESRLFQTMINELDDEIESWEDDYMKMTENAYPIHPSYAQIQKTIESNGYTYNIYIQSSINNPSYFVWIICNNKIIWKHSDVKQFKEDSSSGIFGYIIDSTSGGEKNTLFVYKLNNMKTTELYSKKDVGDSFAFNDDYIYYLKNNDDDLKYDDCICAQKLGGKLVKKIYSEKNDKYQLTLVCPSNQTNVFLQRSNWLNQQVGVIKETSVEWIELPSSGSIFVVDENWFVLNDCLYKSGKKYKFPNKEYGKDGCLYMLKGKHEIYIVTIKNGRDTLYLFDQEREIFIEVLKKVEYNNAIVLIDNNTLKFNLKIPHKSDVVCSFNNSSNSINVNIKYPETIKLRLVKAGFCGKFNVPFYIVKATDIRKERGLLVSCYGAYGINGSCSYPIRWLPWLIAGYSLCIGMPRGGRENGDDWWRHGSTAHEKINTFIDSATIIQEAQKITGIKPANTILHGRSAGGWNATYVGQKYNYLLGAVYAEVPYVDVLRTTTNPDLPLTKLEYEEFGDPLHKPEDYKALLKISPMNNIPSGLEGTDMPFVLCRTGFYDRQVAPYEILKYSTRLRENGWHCLVGFDKKSGHFAKMTDLFKQRAQDSAILDLIVGKIDNRTRISHEKHKKEETYTVKRPRLSSSM